MTNGKLVLSAHRQVGFFFFHNTVAVTQNIKLLQTISRGINSLLHHPAEIKLFSGRRLESISCPYSSQHTLLTTCIVSGCGQRSIKLLHSWGNVTSNCLLKSQADILLKCKPLKNDTTAQIPLRKKVFQQTSGTFSFSFPSGQLPPRKSSHFTSG